VGGDPQGLPPFHLRKGAAFPSFDNLLLVEGWAVEKIFEAIASKLEPKLGNLTRWADRAMPFVACRNECLLTGHARHSCDGARTGRVPLTAVPLVCRVLKLLSTLPRTLCNSSNSLVATITGQAITDVWPLGVPGKGREPRQCRNPPVWAKFFGTSHPSQLRGCGPCAPSMPNPAPGRTRYTPTDNDGFERSHSLHKGGATVALPLKAQLRHLAHALFLFPSTMMR
jgi:hypothetical protein